MLIQFRKKLFLENYNAVFDDHFALKKLIQQVSQYCYSQGMKTDV